MDLEPEPGVAKEQSLELGDSPKASSSIIHESNAGSVTMKLCSATIVVAVLIALPAIIYGVYFSSYSHVEGLHRLKLGDTLREALPLAINVVLTVITRGLGLIHASTLRWNLLTEGRLIFNTNLRLFTSSRTNWANSRFFNGLNCVCLIWSFGCASLLFPGTINHTAFQGYGLWWTYHGQQQLINIFAVLLFGLALFVQALLAAWAAWNTSVLTWNSNAVVAAGVCSHRFDRRNGRCMMGIDVRKRPSGPSSPHLRQSSPWEAHSQVRAVVVLIWIIVALCCIWVALCFHFIRSITTSGQSNGPSAYWGRSWAFLPDKEGPQLGIYGVGDTGPDTWVGLFVYSIIFSSIQAVFTLGLHAAELIVNLSRDEENWRLAGARGCNLDQNAILAALSSWKAMLLFAFTPFVHWLFGLSIQLYGDYGLVFRPVQIVYLTAVMLALALFITVLAFKKETGPQPAAFGHIETLLDLIDEWPSVPHRRLFWGHKSYAPDTGTCHAGTSGEKLPQVRMEHLYS